ncbi:NAD(P)H-dependent glycerol-3-phosphate dehydrogenase [Roseibacillus ishigakijimensis]|uniref:Glycerol-3-phosphate dehydrogenase [NAD(P)+] n=1 Tax=Roseibacillus ishigakijimensis TaxID=454146 RepID=A0A934VIB9_9BACT|nr:NAD(P)H-dependent glycerol-3-phosphate dehydrogenase [Roseibacillus ishigakijimensis]MBK1834918.1 NAD(P)-dependent glycerol-3-phosphate dehydrogenase [Roseibacillus ishigakijimensis]
MKTTIIGAGSWGTALGILAASNGHQVTLLTRDPEHAETMGATRANERYLPGVGLPEPVTASAQPAEALAGAELVLFVIPTSGYRETAQKLRDLMPPQAVLLTCAKGIERGSGLRMSQILSEIYPGHAIAVLSGPNHAEEIARGLPACAVIGAAEEELAIRLQDQFSTDTFRAYTSTDIAGIELGGAIKNVYALAAGIATGLKLGDNALAALATRSLAEMTRLGMALGGQAETFAGLSGVGDLIATCFSTHSRNHQVGLALAAGDTAEEAEKRLGMVAEGVPNTLSIYETSRKIDARTPLVDAMHAILYQNQPAPAVLHQLLTRDHRAEAD